MNTSSNSYILRDQTLVKRIIDMMELSEEDRKLIERLAPMIEDSLKYKIVRSIIDALEETSYPPEEMMREDFIRDIEEAENNIKDGKSKRYNCDAFKKQFQPRRIKRTSYAKALRYRNRRKATKEDK